MADRPFRSGGAATLFRLPAGGAFRVCMRQKISAVAAAMWAAKAHDRYGHDSLDSRPMAVRITLAGVQASPRGSSRGGRLNPEFPAQLFESIDRP